MKKLMILKGLVVMIVSVMLSVSLSIASEGRENEIIKGENHNIRTLDPIKPISVQAAALIHQMYDSLVSYNKDNPAKPLPNLAQRWDVNSDSTEWTFYLRKGVKFTSGNELTAKDVVYSITRGIKGDFPVYPPLKNYIDPDTGFTVVNDYTVKMNLKVGYAGFLFLLGSVGASVLDKVALEKITTDDDPIGSLHLNDNSLGSGPFLLKKWEREERVTMVKNPNYWGIKAGYHRVPIYQTFISLNVKEPTVQKMMLERGDIDFTIELTKDIVDDYARKQEKDVKIIKYNRYVGTSILMNPKHPPFADPSVRNAVRHAIDYDTIIKELLSAVRMDRPIFKPMVGTDDSILYNYDLAKAKSYMAASKFPNGFDFTIFIGTGIGLGADWETLALKLQSDLSKIGINMKIEQYEWSVMDEKLFSGSYNAQLNWFGTLWAETEGIISLAARSEGIILKDNGYSNAEVDRLADLAVQESDTGKRFELLMKINRIFAKNGPNAFIAQELSNFVCRKDIHGFDGNPDSSLQDYAVLYRRR